ncbi:hypothetical protein [Pseudodesulfovibrio sp. zrk46]|uniref:hypothetical protein n=1 Tax=Pseudodesulfovibrio sp. zrk46 TaxID=2725288 RepID=UPI00144975B6|nr:hypothetical protein [Pseudodesulfovibrio sp. zrk46]QJB56551.1 hypothetical protein HFN16_09075 [Pseudodesulfovibrio sp. zrk46]
MDNITQIKIGRVSYKNPIFIASTPAADSTQKALEALENGAGAVILKTILPTSSTAVRKGYSFAKLSPNKKTWFNTGSTAHEMDNTPASVAALLETVHSAYPSGDIPIIPSIATKYTTSASEIDFESIKSLVEPIALFSGSHGVPINIELNLRYMIRVLERGLCHEGYKNIADEYFSVVEGGITDTIIKNVCSAVVFFDKINSEMGCQLGLILKFPFRTDLGQICLKTCRDQEIVKAVSVVNTIKSPGKLQWGTRGKTKLFQVSGSTLTEIARYSVFQLNRLLDIPVISSGGVGMELQDDLLNFEAAAESSWLLKEFKTLCEIGKHDDGKSYTAEIESKSDCSFPKMRRLISWLNKIVDGADSATAVDASLKAIREKGIPDNSQYLDTVTAIFEKYTEKENAKNMSFKSILALEDILDRIYIGSTAVQVGTAILASPGFSGVKRLCDLLQAFFEGEVFREIVFQESIDNLTSENRDFVVDRIVGGVNLSNYIGLYAKERYADKIELSRPSYEIDNDCCVRCKDCMKIPYCSGAISLNGKDLVIDAHKCGRCGVCFQTCKYGAIVEMSDR